MIKTAEEYAFKLKPDIDHKSLRWTFEHLEEDAHFEHSLKASPPLQVKYREGIAAERQVYRTETRRSCRML